MKITQKCPVCNKEVFYDSWSCDQGIEECITECKNCGFIEHYAYGNTETSIGHAIFGESYLFSEEQKKQIRAEKECLINFLKETRYKQNFETSQP